jgi:anti-sigma B factor antagonist
VNAPSEPLEPSEPPPRARMQSPRPPLHIDAVLEGRTVRFALVGELTYSTAPLFTTQVAEVLGPFHPRLELDVGRLHFCDSVGLSALIRAQRRAQMVGGAVVLSGVHGSLARNLAVTGAGVLFDVVGPQEQPDASAPDGSELTGGSA